MTMRSPEDVIKELNSWDNVQHELSKRGIRGTRDHCYACPVAVFLSSETGMSVDVSHSEAEFVDVKNVGFAGKFELSQAVSRFIENFDGGEYPDLDMDPIDHDQDEY